MKNISKKERLKIGKDLKRIMLPILAAVSFLLFAVSPVRADGLNEKASFNMYMIVPAETFIPKVTFIFKVSPYKEDLSRGNGEAEAVPGILPENGTIPVQDVCFDPDDKTFGIQQFDAVDVLRLSKARFGPRKEKNDIEFDPVSGEQYARKYTAVDFSQIRFPAEGFYRYLVTMELAGENENGRGITAWDDSRIIDAHVEKSGEGSFKVTEIDIYVFGKNGCALGATDGFTAEYTPKDLAFTIKSDSSHTDKYYDIMLKLTGLENGGKYAVSAECGESSYMFDANANLMYANTKVISAETGYALNYFHLKNGQTIVVHGLPPAAEYAVTSKPNINYGSKRAKVKGFTIDTSGVLKKAAGNNKMVKTSVTIEENKSIVKAVLICSLLSVLTLVIIHIAISWHF